jgi:TRAP-type C4-dicarboxylate transport system permease small subunit
MCANIGMSDSNILTLISKVTRILNMSLLKTTKVAIVLSFGITILLCLAQVFFRYLLKSPLFWAEEMMRIFFIWVIYLGISVCFYEKSHIVVSFVYSRFPAKVQRYLMVSIELLTIIFLILMVFLGVKIIWFVGIQKLPATGIPVYLLYLSYPIGALLSVIFVLNSIINRKKMK